MSHYRYPPWYHTNHCLAAKWQCTRYNKPAHSLVLGWRSRSTCSIYMSYLSPCYKRNNLPTIQYCSLSFKINNTSVLFPAPKKTKLAIPALLGGRPCLVLPGSHSGTQRSWVPDRDEWDGSAAFYPWPNRMLHCRPQRTSLQRLSVCVYVVLSKE